MSLASRERAELADELARVGPERPTLCAGWSTRDLLAHMLVRERQPWMAGGILVKGLSGMTDKAMRNFRDMPWEQALALFREGPGKWSPFRIEQVDAAANGLEYFVHHEDVRRALPGWSPRPGDPDRDAELWAALVRMGGMLFRRSPVGVIVAGRSTGQQIVKTGPGVVTIQGAPGELVLFAFGRDDAVVVDLAGDPKDVEALRRSARNI